LHGFYCLLLGTSPLVIGLVVKMLPFFEEEVLQHPTNGRIL
jgi:hypothetical protein